MTAPRHALVVGAGVIGLTSAYRLARDGWRVSVFDAAPATGATWAAAGMLAPFAEITPGEAENYRLQRDAPAAWRDLAEELRDYADGALTVHDAGTLFVGYDHGDRALVEQLANVADSFAAPYRRVTREDEPLMFEGVSARVNEGLYAAEDAWLDPDAAVAALRGALGALGVDFVAARVNSIAGDDQAVHLTSDAGEFHGDVGLLSTGAAPPPSSSRLAAIHEIRPVRGTTVRLRGPDRSSAPTLRAFVRGRSIYLVSRPGGYGVLGASSDEQHDLVVELGELARLLRDALDLVPELETAGLLETRQGLRPASKDHAPFTEVLERRWLWSSGHYRHGVTLAPIVARQNLDLLAAMA